MWTRAWWPVFLATLWAAPPTVRSGPARVDGPDVPASPTAEEVVARHLQAIGGVDVAKSIATRRITYRVHMLGRDPYLMERSWTRPDIMRTGRPGATTYTLTQGARSWRVSPDGRRELPPALAAEQSKLADFDGPLVDPTKKGITLAYAGVVRYDMADLHQVTLTFEDGVQWEMFFDSRTGLLRKMIQPSFLMRDGEVQRGPDAHHYYYDYRPAGSLSHPHLWIQATEDHTHLFVVEEIQLAD